MQIKLDVRVSLGAFNLAVVLDLPLNGVITLFGPSGAGKSTLLRCIAGLERAGRGYVQVGDEVWRDDAAGTFLPTHARSLAYVFQEPRLFSHLPVEKNLAYGYQRTPQAARYLDWDKIIDLLDLGHLLHRRPHHLSGGEKQRVAIGRALLASPKLLLMDEPLASLDQARKQEVLPFIRKLHDELDVPIIYVSHSLSEVLQITDTMVFMQQGKNIATGSLMSLCSQLELVDYLGDMSGAVIETTVAEHDDEFGLTRLHFAGQDLYVPLQHLAIGQKQRVHVLARNVGIALEAPQVTTSFLNIYQAKVIEIAQPNMTTHSVQLKLDIGVPVVASISRKSLHALQLSPGQTCYVLIKAVSLTQHVMA